MRATEQMQAGASAGRLANDLSGLIAANAAYLRKPHKLLIGGEWVNAAAGGTFDVRDPSSDNVIAKVAAGEAADIDRAVAAARRALEDSEWSRAKPVDRERLMHKLA